MKKSTINHFFFCLALYFLTPGRKKSMDAEKASLREKIEEARSRLAQLEQETVREKKSLKDNELIRVAMHRHAERIGKDEYYMLENAFVSWHHATRIAIFMLDDKIESCKRNIERWEQEIKKIDSEAVKDLWMRGAVLISLIGVLWALFSRS